MIHFIVSIIIGGIAGTLAGKIMNSKNALWLDVILGIVGGAVAKAIFGLVGIGTSGALAWVGDIIFGVIGACLVIFVVRAIKKK